MFKKFRINSDSQFILQFRNIEEIRRNAMINLIYICVQGIFRSNNRYTIYTFRYRPFAIRASE